MELIRGAIVYHVYSGHLFFSAVVLFILGIAIPRLRVLALLAIPLALLSGTPMAWWIAIPLLAIAIAALLFRRSLALRIVAIAAALAAAAIEIPWHRAPTAYPAPQRLIVIGDSLASGGFGETRPWPQRLGVPVANLARASDKAPDAFVNQVSRMPRLMRGDAVILEIGGNDMLERTPVADFEKALDGIVRESLPRQTVMLELPLLPGRWAYGAAQRRIAKRHGIMLVPKRVLASVLADAANTDDGLHLTTRGHERMALALSYAIWGATARENIPGL